MKRRRAAIAAGILAVAAIGANPAVAQAPCDALDTDPFVRELRDRVVAYSGLAEHALESHGQVVTCVGAVTDDFDGMRFGEVTLRFEDGAELEVTTFPPESSVTELRTAEGFSGPEATIAALRTHAQDIGLSIDWAAPEVETGPAGERIERYWDADSGLNASASLVYAEGKLVAVRVSMAL
jgi:hypothetical protein